MGSYPATLQVVSSLLLKEYSSVFQPNLVHLQHTVV